MVKMAMRFLTTNMFNKAVAMVWLSPNSFLELLIRFELCIRFFAQSRWDIFLAASLP